MNWLEYSVPETSDHCHCAKPKSSCNLVVTKLAPLTKAVSSLRMEEFLKSFYIFSGYDPTCPKLIELSLNQICNVYLNFISVESRFWLFIPLLKLQIFSYVRFPSIIFKADAYKGLVSGSAYLQRWRQMIYKCFAYMLF